MLSAAIGPQHHNGTINKQYSNIDYNIPSMASQTLWPTSHFIALVDLQWSHCALDQRCIVLMIHRETLMNDVTES